jgi:hypothetical protein
MKEIGVYSLDAVRRICPRTSASVEHRFNILPIQNDVMGSRRPVDRVKYALLGCGHALEATQQPRLLARLR